MVSSGIIPIAAFSLFIHSWGQAQDLYLVIGQSNAAGRGDIPASLPALDGVKVLDDTGAFVDASPNLNIYSTVRKSFDLQGYNLAYTFGETMHAGSSNEIRLVVNARGATSIINWFPGVEDAVAGKPYFDEAVRRVNEALANYPDSALKGILWHQGESNRNRSAYMEDLQDLITLFRQQLGDVPFIAGQLSYEKEDNANETFNENLLALPNLVADTAVVSAEWLTTSDGTHFTAAATQTLGERYGAAMISLQNPVNPPVGPPTLTELLFADTFNRSNNTDLNASTDGQSGSLGPLSYTTRTFDAVTLDIDSNTLRIDGPATLITYGGLVYINDHNFIDAAIATGGGFSVSVDIAAYETEGSSRRMSIGVGQSLAELDAQESVAYRDSIADLLVSYRGTTSSLEIYKNGTLDVDESVTGALPAPPATMRIEYALNDFNAGSPISYAVFFDDSATPFTTGVFNWSGTNENYVSLTSNLSGDARFDNLEIRGGSTGADDYANWVPNYPGVDLSDSAGDFDRDGLTNDEERIWGLDPTSAHSVDPYAVPINPTGSFSYTRRDPLLSGWTYTIWTSTNLVDWTEDTGAVQVAGDPDENDVETVAVTISAPPAGDRLLMQVRAAE